MRLYSWWCSCDEAIFVVVLTSLVPMLPLRTVPVMTVPCPLMGKQWSTEKMKGPLGEREGTNTC